MQEFSNTSSTYSSEIFSASRNKYIYISFLFRSLCVELCNDIAGEWEREREREGERERERERKRELASEREWERDIKFRMTFIIIFEKVELIHGLCISSCRRISITYLSPNSPHTFSFYNKSIPSLCILAYGYLIKYTLDTIHTILIDGIIEEIRSFEMKYCVIR